MSILLHLIPINVILQQEFEILGPREIAKVEHGAWLLKIILHRQDTFLMIRACCDATLVRKIHSPDSKYGNTYTIFVYDVPRFLGGIICSRILTRRMRTLAVSTSFQNPRKYSPGKIH